MITYTNASGEVVTILRLSDLDDWEFYQVTLSGKRRDTYTIALRPHAELREVEYEVWDNRGEEPRCSGGVPCKDTGELWCDVERDGIVRLILQDEMIRPNGKAQ
jgi:hypothetical protein